MNEGKKRCYELAKQAPAMTAEDMQAANALFPSYIFRRRKTREIWTTCCHRYEVLDKNHTIFDAIHMAEPKPVAYCCCCWPRMRHETEKPKAVKVPCPFCGKLSPVKDRKTGQSGGISSVHLFPVGRRGIVGDRLHRT